jgi:hypothetical protein
MLPHLHKVEAEDAFQRWQRRKAIPGGSILPSFTPRTPPRPFMPLRTVKGVQYAFHVCHSIKADHGAETSAVATQLLLLTAATPTNTIQPSQPWCSSMETKIVCKGDPRGILRYWESMSTSFLYPFPHSHVFWSPSVRVGQSQGKGPG